MQHSIGIYAIENLYDMAAYVGATKMGFEQRWSIHYRSLVHGIHQNIWLQKGWNLRGSGWFKFVPLEVLGRGERFSLREQYWIDMLRTAGYMCYNLKPAHENGMPVPSDRYHGTKSFLTVAEIAEYFQCHFSCVCNWLRTGELQGTRRKRVWIITRDAFDRFVELRSQR
jgi:excisionase family DNA binding protein